MKEKRRIILPVPPEEETTLMLTPLIDMVFLVLIFFVMNSTLSMEPAIDVDLPDASSSRRGEVPEIIVTLDRQGVLYIDGQEYSRAGFPEALRQMSADNRGESRMTLRADRGVAYGRIMDIMDLARNIGIYHISLVTEETP